MVCGLKAVSLSTVPMPGYLFSIFGPSNFPPATILHYIVTDHFCFNHVEVNQFAVCRQLVTENILYSSSPNCSSSELDSD